MQLKLTSHWSVVDVRVYTHAINVVLQCIHTSFMYICCIYDIKYIYLFVLHNEWSIFVEFQISMLFQSVFLLLLFEIKLFSCVNLSWWRSYFSFLWTACFIHASWQYIVRQFRWFFQTHFFFSLSAFALGFLFNIIKMSALKNIKT